MVYTIQYDWKLFSVFLPSLQVWLVENAGLGYCGMSANSSLQIHFTEEPSEGIITAVDGQWTSLTEEGEAAKWSHYDDLNAAEADAREAILTTDWDNMVPAERKLAMNRTLSAEDKEALLVKFPQS